MNQEKPSEWYQIVDKARCLIDEIDKKLNREQWERFEKKQAPASCVHDKGYVFAKGNERTALKLDGTDKCPYCKPESEKVWCEHISFESNPNGHPVYPSIKEWTYFNGSFHDTEKWKLCPICAVPRPESVGDCECPKIKDANGVRWSACEICGKKRPESAPPSKPDPAKGRLAEILYGNANYRMPKISYHVFESCAKLAVDEVCRVVDEVYPMGADFNSSYDVLKFIKNAIKARLL